YQTKSKGKKSNNGSINEYENLPNSMQLWNITFFEYNFGILNNHMTPHFLQATFFNQYIIENAANYFEQISLQNEYQNIDLDELPLFVSNRHITIEFEKLADFFKKTVLQKENWNLEFDELPQFVSNQHIMIEFEKVTDYFEQIMLQKEDRNLDFDKLSQHISNQHTTVEFEKMPDDLEPILFQREERENSFIDFNELEHNHRDQEFVHFIEDYLKRIRKREEELIRAQEAQDNMSVNNFNVQQTQNAIDKENI
ncbi:22125_t:CDS:2, partial [Gigaspora margarita]